MPQRQIERQTKPTPGEGVLYYSEDPDQAWFCVKNNTSAIRFQVMPTACATGIQTSQDVRRVTFDPALCKHQRYDADPISTSFRRSPVHIRRTARVGAQCNCARSDGS